jgi:hypothetical protein
MRITGLIESKMGQLMGTVSLGYMLTINYEEKTKKP